MRRQLLWAIPVILLLGAGCQSGRTAHVAPTGPAAPLTRAMVLVSPIDVSAAPDRRGSLSPEELRQILIAKLSARGIQAVPDDGAGATGSYRLSCAAPRLGYAVARRFPRRIAYDAQLQCRLADPATGTVRWERSFERRYDVTVLLNTMTKLPVWHDAALLQECVAPVWDGMAYSARLFFERPPAASPGAPAAQPPPMAHLPQE